MTVGYKRTAIARIGVALAFICGLIGLLAGLIDRTWRLGAIGWFTGGTLLALIAIFALLDGAIGFQKARIASPSARP